MDSFRDLIQALQDDLTVNSTSTLFSEPVIKRALNRAYNRAGGLFRWPETEDAKKTSTVTDQEYYDYPDNWRPDTIWKIEIDGIDYGDPLVFKDYLQEKDDSWPSGLKLAWSSQWRRFFIYPIPTTNGNNNISVWGQKVVEPLVNDDDVTIFSYSMQECNEAIAMEALAILKDKGEIQQPVMRSFVSGTLLLSAVAQNILNSAFNRVRQEQAKYEKTQPFFDVPNFFKDGRAKQTIGDFD